MTYEKLLEDVMKDTEEHRRAALADIAEETEKIQNLKTELESQRSDFMSSIVNRTIEAAKPKTEPGIYLARMTLALIHGKNDPERAAKFATKTWAEGGDFIAKALSAGTDTEGGFLIPEEVAADIIELLRAQAIIPSFNPGRIALNGQTFRLPKLTGGSQGGWIGENANAPTQDPTFGTVNLTPKKYASLVPLSNDLIRRSPQSVESIVRDDMVGDIAAATDIAYIRADGTGGQPVGMSNIAGINTFAAAAGATPAVSVTTSELIRCLRELMDDNVRMTRPGWLFAPRTWAYLVGQLDANSNRVWKPEMDNGTLLGFPFRVTTQIPVNLGVGTDESEIFFVDFSNIVIGDALPVSISVSDTAAYHDGSNVVASFSLDQTVVRAIIETDIVARHAETICLITGVQWA